MKNKLLSQALEQSWKTLGLVWPLTRFVATNPLHGMLDLPFEKALIEGSAYFQNKNLPVQMQSVNRATIKWLQAFYDQEQAAVAMPLRYAGLFAACKQLLMFDAQCHKNDPRSLAWLQSLSDSPHEVIEVCLQKLGIAQEQWPTFLTLMLTTLPGWSAYTNRCVVYQDNAHPVSHEGYMAVRLIITCLLFSDARILLDWHAHGRTQRDNDVLATLIAAEDTYRQNLLSSLVDGKTQKAPTEDAKAQFVFCIDVRSEPFRRAVEAQGPYQTYGAAGFFGLPIKIKDPITDVVYSACPVLVAPQHTVKNLISLQHHKDGVQRRMYRVAKDVYQSLKYAFTSPFAVVETLGLLSGVILFLRTFSPRSAAFLQKKFFGLRAGADEYRFDLSVIPVQDQCTYAYGFLSSMGFTSHFAPLVVLCGHGSATENNAFASGLDCGACAGSSGGNNARIMASICNEPAVRTFLAGKGITIPESTRFIAAEHNTTTDELTVFDQDVAKELRASLDAARISSCRERAQTLGYGADGKASKDFLYQRSIDWAQTRPEWGLARNASFIVAPRALTASLNLEGRAFLHSYEWEQDKEGAILRSILAAPVVVGQWINAQYLFSTLDPVAYGSGSKVTQNVTGKMGVMQGNASDLMHGLPLQSVYSDDDTPYHQPLRLQVVVYAPREMLHACIEQEESVKKLVVHGWITISCVDPQDNKTYVLSRECTWLEN